MPTISKTTSFPGPRGDVEAWKAKPDSDGPFPAILILHEGLGLTAHTRALASRFAEAGYLAFAPNLFSHDAVHQTFTEAEVARGIRLFRAPDREAEVATLPVAEAASARRVWTWLAERDTSSYLPDAQAAVQFLAARPKVAADAIVAIGFSLGGGLVGQLAIAGAPLAAGVVFYGQIPAGGDVSKLAFPLDAHYAADDPAINEKVPAVSSTLREAGKAFTFHSYEGTKHGFFNESRPSYHARAAELAWQRTLDFVGQATKRKAKAA